MEVIRFDEKVSVPVSNFESNFRIGPLTGDHSSVRVQVIRLPAGGSIGRQAAKSRQLLAVITGAGVVSGGDGEQRVLQAGFGAVWEEGEEHDASSEGGFTAIGVEGVFELWAFTVTRHIVVEDYDTHWPNWFDAISDHLWPAIEDVALRIEHVGSTSVPGLAAKPIIDLDIVVARAEDISSVASRLAEIGYRWRGDLGVVGREAFAGPADSELPAHNLYLVVENSKPHQDHWLLRELLREDPVAREEYAELKRKNALRAQGDMERYVAMKADHVATLLTRARAERGLPPEVYWDPSDG